MAGNIEIRPDSKYYMELSRLVLSPNEEVMKDALDEPADTRTRIWLLHEELCQKASRYAKLAQQPMDNFYVSRAELKELDSDKERLVLLMMKIHTVDDLLAAGQGPAAAPSGPSEMASRSTTTVAPIMSCPDRIWTKSGNQPRVAFFSAHKSELGYKFTAIDRWPSARQRGTD